VYGGLPSGEDMDLDREMPATKLSEPLVLGSAG
jgi:hypothetical protein